MIEFTGLKDFTDYRRAIASKNIGFVPTMGALHEGHSELLKRSVAENDVTVLSIYVNQTQFNNPSDLECYPSQLASDLSIAKGLGVDAVLMPSFEQMYPDGFKYQIDEVDLSRKLCGEHRPGHFCGVLSVVMKFFNIVRPSYAYFGEKDFQQLSLIRGMVDAFFLEVEVVGVPTVRELDGLAKSSRNLNLTEEQRKIAPELFKALQSDLPDLKVTEQLQKQGFEVDYLQTIGARRFGAASLGAVRLIDNVEVA